MGPERAVSEEAVALDPGLVAGRKNGDFSRAREFSHKSWGFDPSSVVAADNLAWAGQIPVAFIVRRRETVCMK